MKILYLTHSRIDDRSFGGAMRANAVRDALMSLADVDTLMIHGGNQYAAADRWTTRRVRAATVSRYGVSPTALRERSRLRRWVAKILAEGGYDCVVAQYLDLALLVPRAERARMIFDPDDFRKTMPVNASPPTRAKLAVRNRLARVVAKQSRHVWYANPAVDQLPPTPNRSFLPNVIIAPDPSRKRVPAIAGRLLMVGFFEHAPNVEGLIFFHDAVLPQLVARHPSLALHIVGRADEDVRARAPNATFHGFVDDLAEAYDRAHLVIAPILSGGGTQIKVIDALAHGRPLLCSQFAHQGFAADLKDGVHLLVAESVDDWVAKATRALTEDRAMVDMSARGEQIVRERYGPARLRETIAQTLAALSAPS